MPKNYKLIIVEELKNKALSISDIQEKTKLNWRTAKKYVEELKQLGLVFETKTSKKRIFHLRQQGHYFNIPLKTSTQNLTENYFSQIRQAYKNIKNKEPTKKQVYKTMYLINKKDKNLPLFWYKYGPCSIIEYRTENLKETKPSLLVNETVEKYGHLSTRQLTNIVYKDNKLYELKTYLENDLQRDVNSNIVELIKFLNLVPEEVKEQTNRIVQLFLKKGYNKELFEELWDVISIIYAKKTINHDDKEVYFNHKIKKMLEELELSIKDFETSRDFEPSNYMIFQEAQKQKMKELWDNEEDELWNKL